MQHPPSSYLLVIGVVICLGVSKLDGRRHDVIESLFLEFPELESTYASYIRNCREAANRSLYTGCSLSSRVWGRGFHLKMEYIVSFKEGNLSQAELWIIQRLKPDVYVNPFELAGRHGRNSEYRVFGDVDLELPAPSCNSTLLVAKSMHLQPGSTKVSIPIHLKYPSLISQSRNGQCNGVLKSTHRCTELDKPIAFLVQEDPSECRQILFSGTAVEVHVPAGNEDHIAIVIITNGDCEVVLMGSTRNFSPSASTYLGSGNVKSLKQICSKGQEVFVNAILTAVQVRNLEEAIGSKILDRISLIVGIFAKRARTKEAKLQVELACLQLARSRLVRVLDSQGRPSTFGIDGLSEVVSGRERGKGVQKGGLGGGGQGEKEISLQRSRLEQKIRKIKDQIEFVKKTRNVHRQARIWKGIPVVAVVGYTNTGKSTLVGKLTKEDLECDDLYFKTLDPISRKLRFKNGQFCIVSDTVGFISELPVCLFAAFRATLEEATHADIILHVIDASAENMELQRAEVYKTLRDVGVCDWVLNNRTLEVYNKVDLLEASIGALQLRRTDGNLSILANPKKEDFLRSTRRRGIEEKRVVISALEGFGLEKLVEEIQRMIQTNGNIKDGSFIVSSMSS